jgi:dipeptidyl-peptidase-4
MENETKHLSREDYMRAEDFLPWNLKKRIFNAEVKPVYTGKPDEQGEAFWYLNKGKNGKTFKFVDPENDIFKPLFDHVRLAAALSQASGTACTGDALPFDTLEILEEGKKIRFRVEKTAWECDLETYLCTGTSWPENKKPGELLSPDEKWAAFRREFNLWVRNIETDEEIQLTVDGEKHFDYGGYPEDNTMAVTLRPHAAAIPPMAIWSSDSKKLVTQRIDQRKVKDLYLLQSCPEEGQRPVLHTYKYAMVGDEHLNQKEVVILDVEKRKVIFSNIGPVDGDFMGPVELKQVWWGENDDRVYYVLPLRDKKTIRLYEIDAESGKSRLLVEEKANTFAELTPILGTPPNVRIFNGSQEILWPSERDGWANLYRYDAGSGEMINQVTNGAFVVWEIKRIDEESGWLYFMGGSHEPERDPYYKHLYRVNLDGSGLNLLTPEDAEHNVTFSPGGKYFVDTFSRIDQPPVTVLRAVDGGQVRTLETADISLLLGMGWLVPEPFSVKARDGVTDIYGAIFHPSHFDPSRSYPVIDAIYPGPQHTRTPKSFEPDPAQALAELGFIVITIDGLGNMGRSKANHDVSYGKFTEAGGLEDHIKGIRQLAEHYPYMDLSRVGIFGHSGGGFASTKAILQYPEFYKVAVSSAGNHDQRGYLAGWGELYNGLLEGDNFVAQANPTLAANLKGKLLLAAGDMDDNVHMALTMQVVDALIKADKDFDMLILPNRNHTFSRDVYFIRKLWDYFVTHLQGATPPQGYAINPKDVPPMELPF